MLGTGSIWEDIHPVHQQVVSMLGIPSPSNAGVRMSAMRVSVPSNCGIARDGHEAAHPDKTFQSVNDQKCQRCALATRKSRNTWMRATDLSSSGYTKYASSASVFASPNNCTKPPFSSTR
jgi:hypothetical protein